MTFEIENPEYGTVYIDGEAVADTYTAEEGTTLTLTWTVNADQHGYLAEGPVVFDESDNALEEADGFTVDLENRTCSFPVNGNLRVYFDFEQRQYTVTLNIDNGKYGTVQINGSDVTSYTGVEDETVTLSWEFFDGNCYLQYDGNVPYVHYAEDDEAEIAIEQTGDMSCTFELYTDAVAEFPFDRDGELYTISLADDVPSFLSLAVQDAEDRPQSAGTTVLAEAEERVEIILDEDNTPEGAYVVYDSLSIVSGDGYLLGDGIFVVAESDAVLTITVEIPYTVTVINDPDEGGRVWVDYSPGPLQRYPGESVSVTLGYEEPGYVFDHWVLDDPDSVAEQGVDYILMKARNVIIRAIFLRKDGWYSVTVSVDPNDDVASCELSGDGLTADSNGKYWCPAGTEVHVLLDFRDEGYTFDHYDINGDSSYTERYTDYTVNEDTTITAYCNPPYAVTTSVVPSGTGFWVDFMDDDAFWFVDGVRMCKAGTEIEFYVDTEEEDEEYYFDYFMINGTTRIDDEIATWTVTGATNIVAYMTDQPPEPHSVTVIASPPEGGTVWVYPTYAQEPGEVFSVHYETNGGYTFDHWEYDETKVGSPFTLSDGMGFVIKKEDVTVTAVFTPNTSYPITVTSTGSGTATGPASAPAGSTVTITATPDDIDHYFVMSVNGTTYASGVNTFVMPEEAAAVEVTFLEKRYAVTVDGELYANEPSGTLITIERKYYRTHGIIVDITGVSDYDRSNSEPDAEGYITATITFTIEHSDVVVTITDTT